MMRVLLQMASIQIEIQQAFNKIELLKSLPMQEIANLSKFATIKSVSNGRFLSRSGDAVNEISFILEGAAKVCRASEDGKEVTIALLAAGTHIGIVSLLSGAKRTTDVIATCKSSFLVFEAVQFEQHLRIFPGLTYSLLHSLSGRLEQTTQHLTENSLYDLNRRLALRLLEMAELVELDESERLLVRQRPSHQELANMLGVSREAITRALRYLESKDHIEIADNQVFINSTPN